MHRLQLHYTLSRQASAASVRNPLIDLLQAVAHEGSISGGARALGLSYRHVWGELKRWEDELGNELLVWEKGQSARLSTFGAKLMWAERQAQARLAPQIEALRAELERSFALAFDDSVHVLTLYASHDEAISALREFALRGPVDTQRLHLDVRFTGSVDAIRALNEGRCILAGFHTLIDSGRKTRSEHTYKPLLKPGLHKLIGFATRSQGLMVTPGNPLGLQSLADAVHTQARFANRFLGSGTRTVLDELLDQANLDGTALHGYERVEPSHAAVAQAVASGQCDVGLGIAAAAQLAGLDFVPLVTERYHLVCLKSALEQPAVQQLRHLLQTPAWQDTVRSIAGYHPQDSGQVLAMRKLLPWWHFAQTKPQH
ncbi:MAG: substrate-binding domain-containing protein [Rhodoferax sp.]|nr:substrate-binding domain-containing protein [Rhodoferax sp.]